MTANLWKVLAQGSEDAVDAVEAELGELALAVTTHPLADGRQALELIFSAPPSPELWAGFVDVEINCVPLEPQDWLAAGAHLEDAAPVGGFSLQQARAPLRAGKRLSLDGVHAFGDGHHQTTRSCLAALDCLYRQGANPRRVGDIGCGTGVLGIAAAKLWPRAKVIASDLDTAAVAETQAAMAANGVRRQVQVRQASGFGGHYGRYDLLLMNILARPLARLAAGAAARMRPGGFLILSGLLAEQRGLVLAAYRVQRLALIRQSRQDDWVTLILRKHPQ